MGFSYHVYIGPYAKFPHQKEEIDAGQEVMCINKGCLDYCNKQEISVHSSDFDKKVFCHSCGEKLDIKPLKRDYTPIISEVLSELGMDYDEVVDRFHDLSMKEGMNLDHYFLAPNMGYGFDRETHIEPRQDSVYDDIDGEQIKKEIEGFKKEYKKELDTLRSEFGDQLEIKFGILSFAW